jgi:hypothetical protein
MTFGSVAAKHIADVAKVDETDSPSTDSTFDTYRR